MARTYIAYIWEYPPGQYAGHKINIFLSIIAFLAFQMLLNSVDRRADIFFPES